MKTEYLPLVVAIVAAAASVSGIAFTQYVNTRLERQKWEQAQADVARRALQDAVLAFARDIGPAIQRTELLTWTAEHDPKSVSAAMFRKYDQASTTVLGAIASHRIALAAQDPGSATKADKVADAFYAVDECISFAAIAVRANRQEDAMKYLVEKCKPSAKAASTVMITEFTAILLSPMQPSPAR
jgi:hypothetical protein